MGDTSENSLEWALKNGELDVIKEVVGKNQALANKGLSNGRYPIHVAADYGHDDVLEYLVSCKADVNVKDKYGITPILSAIYESHASCVKLLLSKGASKEGQAPDGSSYYDAAESDDIKALLK